MPRYSNAQVAHLFAHRQAGDSNNLHSDGEELRSYSTVIAFWSGDVMFISSDGMTPTTSSRHLSPLRSAASHLRTFYSSAFGMYRDNTPTPRECIETAAEDLLKEFKNLPRKRQNLRWCIEHYTERRAEILEIAAEFNVTIPELPDATGDLKEKAKVIEEQERQQMEEQERWEEELRKERREADAAQFEAWLETGAGSFPRSYVRPAGYGYTPAWTPEHGTDYLTIRDDKVITSQGAEAPLEHVKKALRFYESRRRTIPNIPKEKQPRPELAEDFAPWQKNGHRVPLGHFELDSIDEQGNVKAGCHRFSAAEVARFIEQWKEVLG